MKAAICASTLLAVFTLLTALTARADEYDDTIAVFKKAGQSGSFFAKSYGYALFPTIGKGGLGVGAAHGSGRVYAKGKHIGDTTMNQVSVGLQAGGQAFSQIIFFEDQRALEEFTSGNFEFGANVQAVAITAAAGASAGTGGTSAGASGGKQDAATIVIFESTDAVPRGPNAAFEILLVKSAPASVLPG